MSLTAEQKAAFEQAEVTGAFDFAQTKGMKLDDTSRIEKFALDGIGEAPGPVIDDLKDNPTNFLDYFDANGNPLYDEDGGKIPELDARVAELDKQGVETDDDKKENEKEDDEPLELADPEEVEEFVNSLFEDVELIEEQPGTIDEARSYYEHACLVEGLTKVGFKIPENPTPEVLKEMKNHLYKNDPDTAHRLFKIVDNTVDKLTNEYQVNLIDPWEQQQEDIADAEFLADFMCATPDFLNYVEDMNEMFPSLQKQFGARAEDPQFAFPLLYERAKARGSKTRSNEQKGSETKKPFAMESGGARQANKNDAKPRERNPFAESQEDKFLDSIFGGPIVSKDGW